MMRIALSRSFIAVLVISTATWREARADFRCPEGFSLLSRALRYSQVRTVKAELYPTVTSDGKNVALPQEFVGKLSNLGGKADTLSQTQLRSIAQWEEYSQSFQETTKANILKSAALYKDAVRRRHPHIQFLEKIGYRFEFDFLGRLKVSVPPVETAIRNYEAIMKEHIASGRILAVDVLIPMRAFTIDGKRRFIRYGDEIPQDAVPYDKLLSAEDFRGAAAKNGFVIGETKSGALYSNLHSALEHDLGHLSAYAEFPEFQKDVTRFNRDPAAAVTPWKVKFYRHRAGYLNEFLEGVGTKNQQRLWDLFDGHGLRTAASMERRPGTMLEYRRILESKSKAQISALISDLQQSWFELVQKPGAAVRDIADQEFYRRQLDPRTSARDIDIEVQAIERRSTLDNRLREISQQKVVNRDRLAELLTALDNTSYFKFEDIVRQSENEKISSESALYVFLCVNQLGIQWANIGYCL